MARSEKTAFAKKYDYTDKEQIMNNLKVGFSRVNVTPPMGAPIAGYYKERYAVGVLDDLFVNAVAFESGERRAIMICVDNAGFKQGFMMRFRQAISSATGVPVEAILISATHTHTGPQIIADSGNEIEEEYITFLHRKLVDAASFALEDLKAAKMGFGIGQAPGVAFIRRFRMKDGSIKTNPGVDNPDIVAPIGDVDDRVNVIRFDREGAESVVVVNFGCHPDVVGGCLISADWPGFVRKTVESAIENTKCIFFNGAEGDVNHVNVHPKGGDFNGMFRDFDDVSRGYDHARYMGRVVAGGVLQAYDKVKYVDVDSISAINRVIEVPSNKARPDQLPEARRINELHLSGRDADIPYSGMMLTTVVAEAARMLRLENAPDTMPMTLSGVRLGEICFVGIPGEPFTGIGRGIKDTEGYELISPIATANGYEGYFPMRDSYDEGGYEARSSNFAAGVAEFIIQEGKALLADLEA